MKLAIATLLFTASVAQADIHLTVEMLAPDQAECISDTVYHDWAVADPETRLFYLDHHAAALLAAYAGVKAGIYSVDTVEQAYAWYGCDWIQTLDLTQRVTHYGAAIVEAERGIVSLDFLRQ